MSKPKLSDEEIQTKRQELLENSENIISQLSEMSPHLLEEDGEEFTQFVGYVKDLDDDVFSGFKNYDVPAHVVEKHKTDVSQVVYKSGTHKVVCDVVTSRLTTRNYVTQAKDVTMTTSVSQMETLVCALVNYSCYSDDVTDYITKDSGFLPALVHTLDAGHTPHLDNVLSDTQNLILDYCMRVLDNCALIEKNIARVRDVGTVEVLLPYLDSHDGFIQLTSLATLANLVNEEEAESLLTNHMTIFTLLIQRLDKAWHSSTHFEDWGNSAPGLTITLRQLARNDANKQVLVEVGCLPLLVEMLDSPYINEVTRSLEALWVLSFDDVNKQKMVDEPNLVKRVWGKYSLDTSSKYRDKIKKSSYGILWSLKYQLKKGDLWFCGIATKIEEQKTEADMKPKEQKTEADMKPEEQKTEADMKPEEQKTVADLTPAQENKVLQAKLSDDFSFKGHLMLSYQWGHKETIKQICQELKVAGVPVWIDVDFMEGSTLETMAKAVEDCSIFIMAVSQGYKNSPNTRLEAGYAQTLKKPIIPLMMERGYKPDGWLGILVGPTYFYDFSGKYPFKDKIAELLREIRNKMGDDTSAAINKRENKAVEHSDM